MADKLYILEIHTLINHGNLSYFYYRVTKKDIEKILLHYNEDIILYYKVLVLV